MYSMELKDSCYDQHRQHIKKQRYQFAIQGPSSQSYGFPSSHAGCESWTIKKAEHRRMILLNCGVGEDSWESLGLQGDQSWIFTGRTDGEAETLILWPPDVKNWLIGKDRDAGKDWRREEKGTTEDEMVGWHLWPNGYEFEWPAGGIGGQQSLVCCSPWGCKELDTS